MATPYQKVKLQYERFPDSFQEMISAIMKYGKFPNPNAGWYRGFRCFGSNRFSKLTAGWGIDYLLLAKQKDNWMVTHVLVANSTNKKIMIEISKACYDYEKANKYRVAKAIE